MGISYPNFLLDHEDHIYRLPMTTFEHMFDDPSSHPIDLFAGQRVRMAQVAIETENRRPIRVIRTNFSILTFDDKGFLVGAAYERHQYARAEMALAPGLGPPTRNQPPSSGSCQVHRERRTLETHIRNAEIDQEALRAAPAASGLELTSLRP